jgi:pilus assembly protein FimV
MVDDTESILTLTSKERAPLEKRPTSAILKVDSPSHISEQTSTSRSSFLSEFTPSDFDALGGEMEEVDPISEADVYLAYGRYKQAEELIRNAINQNPENDECKLKLLEIHYSTENAEAFETFAQELEPTHRLAKPSFWDKVDEMGRELCPDSPLFFDQSQSLPIGENVVELSKLVSSDKSRTVDKPSIKDALPDEIFTYPSFEKTTPTPEIADETDLSLDNYSLFEQPIEGEEIETLILDADSGKVHEPPQHSQASGPNKPQEKTLDDVFAEIARLSGTSDADTEYLDSETLPAQSENILRDKSSSSTIEFEPLSEMDEHETKLDLAKAYFEMGDDEAARLILENVVQQGNETQKEEAWSLLKILNRQEANSRG